MTLTMSADAFALLSTLGSVTIEVGGFIHPDGVAAYNEAANLDNRACDNIPIKAQFLARTGTKASRLRVRKA